MTLNETFAERLRNARKMRGLSLRALSAALNGLVSFNALSKYEKGEMMPSSSVVIALAKALEVKVDDFFRPITVRLNPEEIKYRKRSTMNKKNIDFINYYVSNCLEKYLEVEKLCHAENNFMDLSYSTLIHSEADARCAAMKFREVLHLGLAPITSPIELLESIGVKIIEIDAHEKFDGNSFTLDDVFVVVLNKKFPPERKRLTLFHEIGHKVMTIEEGLDEEKICNIFASEVLLPTEIFITWMGGSVRKDISLVELRHLQEDYGISVDALMMKAHQCTMISDSRYKYYFIHKNKDPHFKNRVERSTFPAEEPGRYERLVYQLLAKEVISESKCASLLDCSVSDVRSNLNLV